MATPKRKMMVAGDENADPSPSKRTKSLKTKENENFVVVIEDDNKRDDDDVIEILSDDSNNVTSKSPVKTPLGSLQLNNLPGQQNAARSSQTQKSKPKSKKTKEGKVNLIFVR